MKSVHILSSLANRSVLHLRRILFRTSFLGLFFLLCSLSAGAQQPPELYTLSYSSYNTTYYLAVNNAGTALERASGAPVERYLWKRVQLSSGQYTFQHLLSEQYLEVTSRGGVRLSSAATALNISDNNKIYVRSGWSSYYIRYNNGWTVTTSSNQGQTFTFTAFQTPVPDVSFEFVVNDEPITGSDNNFLTWLQPFLSDLEGEQAYQQMEVRVKYQAYNGYTTADKSQTINYSPQEPVYLQGGNAASETYATMSDDLQWVSGNADGNHYVALVFGPVWDETKQGWIFTFKPVTETLPDGTSPDPLRDGTLGKEEVTITSGETTTYRQWLSQIKFTVEHHGTTATSPIFYLARATFHKETGEGITLKASPVADRFPWAGASTGTEADIYAASIPAQTFTITGTNETGFRWVRADGTIVTKGTYPDLTDEEIHSLNNLEIIPLILDSEDDIRYRFFQQNENTDLDPMWLETVNQSILDNTVTVDLQIKALDVYGIVTQANTTGAPRRARWIIAYDYMDGATKKTAYMAVSIVQNSQYSDDKGLHLKHNEGLSGRPLEDNGFNHKLQGVHTLTTTLYYIDGDEIELRRKERGYLGWTRWYDYTNRSDLGDLYVDEPRYRDADGSTDFELIGSKPATAHGRYFRRDFNFGENINAVDKGDDQNYPIIRIKKELDNEEDKAFRIAVDASNYIDFAFEAEHQPDPNNPTVQADAVTEPTLSTRQIFDIRPASERAEDLAGVKTSTRHEVRYNTEKYLEDHTIVAPALNDNKITLSPQYYYTNPAAAGRMADFGYIYEEGGKFYRIGYTAGAEEAKWYRNGVETSIGTITSTNLANVYAITTNTSLAGQTITYTLETESYNLCRFVVEYKSADEVGPSTNLEKYTDAKIEENYDVLATLDFNYTLKPKQQPTDKDIPAEENVDYFVNTYNGTSIRFWNHPLEWEESTFGFRYGSSGATYQAVSGSNRHPNRFVSPPFNVSYGEYALVNKLDHGWWSYVEQRGGADNGYMLYVDGSAEQGLVAFLQTDAKLCAGQKMYCSAWLSNPNTSYTKPVLLFVIEGCFTPQSEDEEKEWHSISEYTPGDLQGVPWQQVCFEISLEQDYDEYRVSIYNYATNNQGNDFCVDDIKIFASRQPLAAYQLGSLCNAEYIDAVIRLDFTSMDRSAMEVVDGHRRMYFDIYNETKEEVLDINYLNNNAPNPAEERYGWVVFPTSPDDIPEKEKYEDLVTFFAAIDGLESPKAVGYVKENVSGEEHWVLYLRHRIKIPDGDKALQDKYQVRVAYHVEDLVSPSCAMQTYLPVRNAFELQVNGTTEMTPVQLCGNARYDVKLILNVTKTEGDKIVEQHGVGLNDWLLMLNAPAGMTIEEGKLMYLNTENEKIEYRLYKTAKYPDGKYTYSDIENALRHDLRQSLFENGVNLNPNKEATTLAQIDSAAMTHMEGKTFHNYTVIRELVEAGILVLAQEQVSPYVQEGDRVSCLVLPIPGTGYMVNDQGQPVDKDGNVTSDKSKYVSVDQCYNPRIVELYAEVTERVLEVGMSAGEGETLPDAVLTNPTVVRTSLNDKEEPNTDLIALPIRALENITIGNQINLVRTTDPAFVVQDDQKNYNYGFSPDKLYIPGTTVAEEYYKSGDSIKLQPRLIGNEGTLREGFDYTFEITMQQTNGSVTGGTLVKPGEEEIVCAVGTVYFTLRIVPSRLKWNPQSSGTSNWNDDNNWVAVDANGNVIEGAKGCVPLAHSNIIIEAQDDDSKYPVLVDPEKYMSEHQGLNAYDVGYQPASCNYIYLEAGAKLLNQHYLTYTKAFVDKKLKAGEWTLFSPALQETYLGDIYTPGDPKKEETEEERAKYDSNPFEPGTFNGDRNYDYAYYHSFYNQAVKYIYANGNDVSNNLTEAQWSKWVNDLNTLYKTGHAYQILGFGPQNTPDEELMVRLPKSDQTYEYFYADGTPSGRIDDIQRTEKAGKFAYTLNEPTGMKITLTNQVESEAFMFGNPTMAYLDMQKFLEANTVLSPTYLVWQNDSWQVVNLSLNTDYQFLSPMSGVMLKTINEVKSTEIEVSITPDMLLSVAESKPVSRAPRRAQSSTTTSAILEVRAVNGDIANAIYLGESLTAADGVAEEDAYAVVSGMNEDAVFVTPLTLHTDNQGVALAIDIRQYITRIPLVFNIPNPNDVEATTDLWFTGVEQFTMPIYLEDTQKGTETQILNGLRVTVETPASGEHRYFIRMRDKKPDVATEVEETEMRIENPTLSLEVQYTNLPQKGVLVTANMQIENLTVCDVLGKIVTEVQPKATTAVINLPQGAYLIKTTTKNAENIGKVIID